MQQMLKTRTEDDQQPVSAFYPTGKSPTQVGSLGKSPTLPSNLPNKRDSGYGTDFSPASNTSTTRRFTYEDTETAEVPDVMSDIESEVFEASGNDAIREENESDDDTDKEVEELTGGGDDFHRPVSQPIQIKRPSAPIPTPEENGDGTEKEDSSEDSDEGYFISATFNHTRWSNMPRNKFRPIASRSVGTQTPSPHSQLINEAMGPVGSPRMSRVATLTRLRIRSESEDIPNATLPDVIPMLRDRSVSLPDVPSYRRAHEQDVGRELRRISDEFNSSFTPVRRRQLPASFPLRVNIDIYACLTTLRRFLSSSPVYQNIQNQEDAINPQRRNDFFH